MWAKLGNDTRWRTNPSPSPPGKLVSDTVEYPVQVNGKLCSHITVAADLDTAGVEAAALNDSKVAAKLAGRTPKKVIVIPGRMVNIVA